MYNIHITYIYIHCIWAKQPSTNSPCGKISSQWKFQIDFRLKMMRAILLKYLHLRESKDEFQNLKASFTLWCGNFMWLDIGIGLFRQSGVESQTLLIICCFCCVDKKSPDNSLSVHLSLVGFPNQMFYAKYLSSVLSPSMTRSPAVMLSPHQWSMPCPI